MRQVPVAQTVRDAYVFAFRHLGGIIGLIWIPMVLLTIAQFFTLLRYYNAMIDFVVSRNATSLGPACLMLLGDVGAALLLYAMMFVAVVQLVLGSRPPGAIAHFAFGPLEWRMARPLLAGAGVAMLFAIGVMLLLTVMMAASKMSQENASVLVMLVLAGAVLVVAPRVLLLLPAVAVNEAVPVIRRAWTLSQGNFLRLLAVLAALVVPPTALIWAANVAIGGGLVLSGDDQTKMVQTLMHAREILPLACGVSFFIAPVLVGLIASASVSAWRALADERALDVTA
jgi:hypothetical protein